MKVVCIHNPFQRLDSIKRIFNFTIGKTYTVEDVVNEPAGEYILYADDGSRRVSPRKYFQLIEDYREDQINKILR